MRTVRTFAKRLGVVAAAAAAVGIVFNFKDIKRYLHISTM